MGDHVQVFQSTPPARGATRRSSGDRLMTKEISIHAPREGGDVNPRWTGRRMPISIHAPREGGDEAMKAGRRGYTIISIHAPREGGDFRVGNLIAGFVISIHAPREGGDLAVYTWRKTV